jgi:hypothetical protein
MYGGTSFAADGRSLENGRAKWNRGSREPVHAARTGRSTFHRMTSGRPDETWRRQTFAQSGATIKGRSDDNQSKIRRGGRDFEATAELTEIFNERL